jgi:alpha-galactosidase
MRQTLATAATIGAAIVLCATFPRAQAFSPAVHDANDGLALTPPMGWYPWNIFGQEPQNEKLVREIVDALVASGMKEAGYTYVGPDEGICFYRGADGLLTTNLERYPSGLRGLGDYVHKKGVKYALYTDAGTHTCSKGMPGTKGHEFEDMRRFAEWRADYIKIDWCNTQGQDIMKTYTTLHNAQRAAGRPIVHSLCSWGEGEPWKWAARVGNLWRTTEDICGPGLADWEHAIKIALFNEKLRTWAGPGHWNDPDMLIAGMPGLTEAQNRSFFSLWSMMAAPLMAGNDLRDMSEATIKILTNPEVIAVNQDPLGIQGHIVRTEGEVSIWAGKPLFDGSQAVLVFNHGRTQAEAVIALSDFGWPAKSDFCVRDLWQHVTSNGSAGPDDTFSVTVGPQDVRFLRVSGSNEFPLPPVIVADSYLLSFRASGEATQHLTGTIALINKGTSELPLWKVYPGLPSWLTATVAMNGRTQTVTNRVSTAGLRKGFYHAVVRLDNVEPISGKPMSAVYYDVDLDVGAAGIALRR